MIFAKVRSAPFQVAKRAAFDSQLHRLTITSVPVYSIQSIRAEIFDAETKNHESVGTSSPRVPS